jgi:hypothetical protein
VRRLFQQAPPAQSFFVVLSHAVILKSALPRLVLQSDLQASSFKPWLFMIQKRYQYNITALDRICTRWVTVRSELQSYLPTIMNDQKCE